MLIPEFAMEKRIYMKQCPAVQRYEYHSGDGTATIHWSTAEERQSRIRNAVRAASQTNSAKEPSSNGEEAAAGESEAQFKAEEALERGLVNGAESLETLARDLETKARIEDAPVPTAGENGALSVTEPAKRRSTRVSEHSKMRIWVRGDLTVSPSKLLAGLVII